MDLQMLSAEQTGEDLLMKRRAADCRIHSVMPALAAALILSSVMLTHGGDLDTAARVVVEDVQARDETVTRGQVVRQQFTLYNTGRSALDLEDVAVICIGRVIVPSRRIDPGQRLTLRVEYDTVTLSEFTPTVLWISVRTNDHARPTIEVKSRIQVASEFTVSTKLIDFGQYPALLQLSRTVSIARNIGNAKILSVESTNPAIEVSMIRFAGRDVVRARSSAGWRGSHFGNVVVRTSSAFNPEIRIHVRGTGL